MITRALWIVFVLGIAGATAGIQLDRQSRYVPTIANAVPEPFRAFALRHTTNQALQADQSALALEEARKLVARRPMVADHLRLLSAAAYKANDTEMSIYTIQLAAQRGWRDRPTQRAMLELALAAGDQPEAARRYAALFVRRSEEEAELSALAQALFGPDSEPARAELATILAGADRWHRTYLRKGPIVLPQDALIDITRRAREQGARFDCELASAAVKRLNQSDAAAGTAFAKATGCEA